MLHLLRGVPLGGEQRDAEPGEQLDLPPALPALLGKRLQQPERMAEMTAGLDMRRAGRGALPRELGVAQGLLRDPGLLEVVSQQLGLRFDGLRGPRFQGQGDLVMEPLPGAAQQRVVGPRPGSAHV